MSIQKPTFTELSKDHIPYTIIPNQILQNIFQMEALATYCYLISLPEKWNVNRPHLMKHFGIGRDKLDKSLKYLLDNFLIEYRWIRKLDGTVEKVTIHVKDGNDFIKNIVNMQQYNTTTLKTHSVDYPLSGKTAPIKEIIHIKENKEIEREKLSLSDLYRFSIEEIELAKSNKLNLDSIFEKFKTNLHKKRKKKYQREDFKIWLLREVEFKRDNQSKAINQLNAARSTIKEWGSGHPDYDRLHR